MDALALMPQLDSPSGTNNATGASENSSVCVRACVRGVLGCPLGSVHGRGGA